MISKCRKLYKFNKQDMKVGKTAGDLNHGDKEKPV
jgi:hypothetical protein